MKATTKIKGNLTELETAAALVRRDCGICIPYGDRNRYDLVADIDGKFLRIQCKSSVTHDGGKTFTFKTHSVHYVDGQRLNVGYTKEEIDYFATVFNNKCYLFPVGENNSTSSVTLRLKDTDNSQSRGINWAKDYEVGTILSRERGALMKEKHRRERESSLQEVSDKPSQTI